MGPAMMAVPSLLSGALVAAVLWRALPPMLAPVSWELRATAALLSLPGFAACYWLGLNFFSLSGQLAAVPISLLAYGGVWAVLRQAPKVPAAGRLISRRSLLIGATALGALAWSGARHGFENRTHLALTRLRLSLKDLPPELEGLRIVLMSDLHCGPHNGSTFLRKVVRQVNKLEPDLVVIPGDFVEGSPRYVKPVGRVLKGLKPRIATLGTLGNHDHWEGGEDAGRGALEEAGVVLLDNRRLFLDRDRILGETPGERGLLLAGVGDLWTDRVDLEAALGGVSASVPRLLLSHNPDVAEEPASLQTDHRVDLMLSGHTHGGQCRIPGIGAVAVPSYYGQKYVAGLVKGPRWPVYVTRGVGTTGIPIRLGAPPEITLFVLRTS